MERKSHKNVQVILCVQCSQSSWGTWIPGKQIRQVGQPLRDWGSWFTAILSAAPPFCQSCFLGIVNKGNCHTLLQSEVKLFSIPFTLFFQAGRWTGSSDSLYYFQTRVKFRTLTEPLLLFHFLNSQKTKLKPENSNTNSRCQELQKFILDIYILKKTLRISGRALF